MIRPRTPRRRNYSDNITNPTVELLWAKKLDKLRNYNIVISGIITNGPYIFCRFEALETEVEFIKEAFQDRRTKIIRDNTNGKFILRFNYSLEPKLIKRYKVDWIAVFYFFYFF